MTGILKCLMLLDSRFSATHHPHIWPILGQTCSQLTTNHNGTLKGFRWPRRRRTPMYTSKKNHFQFEFNIFQCILSILANISMQNDANTFQWLPMPSPSTIPKTANYIQFHHPKAFQNHQSLHFKECINGNMIIDDPLFELITAKGQLFLSSLRAFTSQHFVAETARRDEMVQTCFQTPSRLMTMRAEGRMSSTAAWASRLTLESWRWIGSSSSPPRESMPRAKQSIAKLGMSQGHTGVQMVSNMSNQGLNTFE